MLTVYGCYPHIDCDGSFEILRMSFHYDRPSILNHPDYHGLFNLAVESMIMADKFTDDALDWLSNLTFDKFEVLFDAVTYTRGDEHLIITETNSQEEVDSFENKFRCYMMDKYKLNFDTAQHKHRDSF